VNNIKLILTRQAMYVQHTTEVCSCDHCCHGGVISITYSQHVFVAIVTQHAKHMQPIILSSGTCPALPHFSTLSHKWHNFQKNVIEHNIFIFIFSSNTCLKCFLF